MFELFFLRENKLLSCVVNRSDLLNLIIAKLRPNHAKFFNDGGSI